MAELDKKKLLTMINERLVSSGERERLKEHLAQRLVECGWKEEVKQICRDTIQKKSSTRSDQLTIDEIYSSIAAKSKEIVPDSVKDEMIQLIRQFLTESS